MNNPDAQTDSICIASECCMDLRSLTRIIDSLTKIIAGLQSLKCLSRESLNKMVDKITLSKRAVLNAISSLEGVIRSDSSNSIDEYKLNSLLNIATRLIECRNSIGEIIDDVTEFKCGEKLQNELTILYSYIDTILIIILALVLSIASITKIDQKMSKRLSSITASMLFASLTNIYVESVQKTLNKCFYRGIRILK